MSRMTPATVGNELIGRASQWMRRNVEYLERARAMAHVGSTPPATDIEASRDRTGPQSPLTIGDTCRYDEFMRRATDELHSLTAGGCVTILAIEIDSFEALTSSHSAEVGVEVLTSTAARIRDAVRPHHATTMVEGNGFTLLLRSGGYEPPVPAVAKRIIDQFRTAIATSAGELSITVSVGISTATWEQACDIGAATLLAQSRAAVASAKRQGRGRLAEFDPIMRENVVQSWRTEQQLRTALRKESVTVEYQPIVKLATGSVVGVEALARWKDADLGTISPALFIPVAEETGLINELGRVVLADAIEQGATWKRSGLPGTLLTVNLSKQQLLDPTLISNIRKQLQRFELSPGQLCLEITESVVMANVAASMTILCQLKDLGVVLAIDDFGTGYSSLSYLRRLPVDILKIDRSFVQAVHNRDDRTITKVIIDLAHTLGMTTIGEGIESASQLEILQELGCDMAQGFLLQRPVAAPKVDFRARDLNDLPTLTLDEHDVGAAADAAVNGSLDLSSVH